MREKEFTGITGKVNARDAPFTRNARKMAHPKDIGIRIRQVRKDLGMTQQEFADKVGMSRVATVSDWERGNSIPNYETLRAIARLAGEREPTAVFGLWATSVREVGADRDDDFSRMLSDPLPVYRGRTADVRVDQEEEDDETGPAYNERREEGELARIGGLPDPLIRTMERESIAAVIRAQAMRDACRAARIEAEKAPTRGLPEGVSSDLVAEGLRALRAWEVYRRRDRGADAGTQTETPAQSETRPRGE